MSLKHIETILCICFIGMLLGQHAAGYGWTARSKFIHCDALHRRLFGCYMDGFESIKASWCYPDMRLEMVGIMHPQ